jgi:SAM-dependent methyltransferase
VIKFFIKEPFFTEERIYKFNIFNKDTLKTKVFYEADPFPNYQNNDNKHTILKKGDGNYLASKIKKIVGYNKKILEVGSGTCQLSMYFSIGTNNLIFALDSSFSSLEKGSQFAKKNNISNIIFVNADLTDDIFFDNYFDFIWCNGVLHHTKEPYFGFTKILKKLKKNQYILIGLYNRYGRLRTIIRKYFYKLFGRKFLYIFDPYLRYLCKDFNKNELRINAWINDQYHHPIESLHDINECLFWFKNNKVKFINCFPNLNEGGERDIFQKKLAPTFLQRFIIQLLMIFSVHSSEGGLFVMIGQKE